MASGNPSAAQAAAGETRLRRRIHTRLERFTHAGLSLELLVPRAADELIDEAAFAADERLPYWAELWPSARALARQLLEAPPPAGPALELGCGVGLPSLVLHARGADVLATDYYRDALDFARVNALRNGLPPLTARLLDWRRIPAGFGRFDRVLIADVLYEQRNADALAEALPRLVSAGAAVWLADPGRAYLRGFLRRMEAAGWEVQDVGVREEVSDPTSGAVSRVQILQLAAP